MKQDQTHWRVRAIAIAIGATLFAMLTLAPLHAFAVCGDGVVDSGEDCDDGGLCTSGDHAGEKCPAAVDGGVDCGEGATCQPYGGDGCAANCITESDRAFVFDTTASVAEIQSQLIPIPFKLNGSQVLTTSSHADADGNYAVVIRAANVHISPIAVAGLKLCACVRGVAAKTCGGSPTGRNCVDDPSVCQEGEGACIFVNGPGNTASGTIGCGANGVSPIDVSLTRDHNTHKDSPDPDPDCTAAGAQVEGPAAKHPGACNGPTVAATSGTGPAGAALLLNSLGITTITDGGTCANETITKICVGGSNPGTTCSSTCVGGASPGKACGADSDCGAPPNQGVCTSNASVCTGGDCKPAKGDNGVACDDDDPNQAAPATVPLTTGTASSTILHANNTNATIAPGIKCGAANCAASVTGQAFNCTALAADPTKGVGGAKLGSAFPALDNATLGDLVVTSALAAVADKAACVGDCDGSNTVSVDELVKGVNIALGLADPSTCPAFDEDKSNTVTVDELVKGVNNALSGCPS
ncbi:MAG TPA: hypothetical protein VMW17_24680 [Candidatus Binatia bacterium]|nr:hypothetical protein [Candidatus Binatia bacterium]